MEENVVVTLPSLETVVEKGAPIEVDHSASVADEAVLCKHVFDHEDNLHIPEGTRYHIYTCSAQAYQYLRPKLTDIFNTFAAVVNVHSRWELNMNAENAAFCELLDSRRPEHQLFVIPVTVNLTRDNKGTYLIKYAKDITPMSGIRFVTQRFMGGIDKDKLKLVMGRDKLDFFHRCFDLHYAGAEGIEETANLALI